MKVKSFSAGLVEGLDYTMKSLDEQLKEELGDGIQIHSLTDTLYDQKVTYKYGTCPGPRVIRVVVYS